MRAHKSEAQSNAEALARRSSTYADEHAASWQIAFDRPTHEPTSLRGYVRELRDAYEAECPKMHGRDLGEGGTPEFTERFLAWLEGQDNGPLRSCLRGMARSADEASRRRASIAVRVVLGGMKASESAIEEGVPDWCAKTVAYDALRVVWRNYSSTPFAPVARAADAFRDLKAAADDAVRAIGRAQEGGINGERASGDLVPRDADGPQGRVLGVGGR